MSSFAVEIVHLEGIEPHPNAERLDLAVIGGYRAVVQKDAHRVGDLVVYVPEASVLPADLIEAFGFTGKLSGGQKNRVKAIRLRGELSQGLVLPLKRVLQVLAARRDGTVMFIRPLDSFDPVAMRATQLAVEETMEGELVVINMVVSMVLSPTPIEDFIGCDLASLMGVVKYEPSIPSHLSGKARARPEWFPYYTDIENIKKFTRTFEPGEEVVITEKLHGTNFGAGIIATSTGGRDGEDPPEQVTEVFVSSRRVMLIEEEENLYWQTTRRHGIDKMLAEILDIVEEADTVVIYGEVIGDGVQDLTYGHRQGDKGFRWFDVLINGQYLNEDDAQSMMDLAAERLGLIVSRVPIMYRGPFSEQIVQGFTDGKETLSGSHVREGVVVKPIVERQGGRGLSRVILKSISGEYLTRKGDTTEHS